MAARQTVSAGRAWSEAVAALPEFLKPGEVGELLRLSEQSVKAGCRDGTMPGAFRMSNGEWRIVKQTLLADIEDQIQAARGAVRADQDAEDQA